MDGERIPIFQFLADRMPVSDSDHVSADILCPIENIGWSDRVHLKKRTGEPDKSTGVIGA